MVSPMTHFGSGCSVLNNLVLGGTFPTMDQFLNDRGTIGLIGVNNGPGNRRDPNNPIPPINLNGKAILYDLWGDDEATAQKLPK